MRGMVRTAVVAALVLGAGGAYTATAHAAPQPGELDTGWDDGVTSLRFWAGEGAVNDIVLSQSATAVRIVDRGAPLTLSASAVEAGCARANEHSVRCPSTAFMGELWFALGDGDDKFDGRAVDYKLQAWGQEGNDTLTDGPGRGVLGGGAGDDTLDGGAGDDHLYDGLGNDHLIGGAGNDYMTAAEGTSEDVDTLEGGAGNDTLWGGYAYLENSSIDSDTLSGGPGNDLFRPGGMGTYDGGAGNDTVSYANWSTWVRVELGKRAWGPYLCSDHLCDPARHTLNKIENVIGSRQDDTIYGDSGANNLDGGNGNDQIYGNGGNDHIDVKQGTEQKAYGGDGNDICVGYGLVVIDTCES